jgi:hypothetical protein
VGISPALNKLLPDQLYAPPGRGHLVLILLSELAFEFADQFRSFLPAILHQVGPSLCPRAVSSLHPSSSPSRDG